MKNKMFQQFAQEVEEILKERGMDYTVKYKAVWKNNMDLNGLVIEPKDERNITPTVYFKDESAEEIADRIEQAMRGCPVKVDPDKWFTKEYFYSHLRLRIIEANEKNRKGLEKDHICYKELKKLKLFATAHIDLEGMDGAMIQIRYEHLEKVEMNEYDLFARAVLNLDSDYKIRTMMEVMMEMMHIDRENLEALLPIEDEKMWVISNSKGLFGAANLFCQPAMMKLFALMETNHFYILPSSIHELIAVKAQADMSKDDMMKMVQEVNATQVAEEDRLCDGVYEVRLKNNIPDIYKIA